MTDYDTWNRALIAYFVEGTPPGALVFLTADDDTLARIGQRLLAATDPSSVLAPIAADAVQDFEAAVRQRVLRSGGRVDLSQLAEAGAAEEPRCVAFLCALVLAATRMGDSGDLDEVNYFGRLHEILGLPGAGRPEGMRSGAETEEPLWRFWNFWLQVQGRLPTALAGEAGPQRFIHYARSQALLREVDRDRLCRLFSDKGWRSAWDAETLLLRVRREAPYLTAQLRELLGSDSQRLRALGDAIHELYEDWRIEPTARLGRHSERSRTLYAGLYREEDPFSGTSSYYLYPRAPRGSASLLSVRVGDGVEPLRPERPGWFYPLGPVDGATLTAGARYPVDQPAEVEELVLPQRDFWILTPDPDAPESGTYATWGAPQLGLPFILLCREEVFDQFRRMEQEQLIACGSEPAPALDGSWFEIRDCVAVSEAWSGAHLENPELYDALRLADACNVSASGGMRVPHGSGWLDQAGPSITVFGFSPEAEVRITDVANDDVTLEREQPTNQPANVPWPGPGRYLVNAVCGGQSARRLVTIVGWDELQLATEQRRESVRLGDRLLCGALLE